MKSHVQTTVSVRSKLVEVDRGVQELILLMNNNLGVDTFNSCEGGSGHVNAYVQFGGEAAFALLPPLIRAILKEQASWKRKHRHECHGCKSMSICLEVDGHSGIVLNWQPYDYPRVLKIFKAVQKATPKPTAP